MFQGSFVTFSYNAQEHSWDSTDINFGASCTIIAEENEDFSFSLQCSTSPGFDVRKLEFLKETLKLEAGLDLDLSHSNNTLTISMKANPDSFDDEDFASFLIMLNMIKEGNFQVELGTKESFGNLLSNLSKILDGYYLRFLGVISPKVFVNIMSLAADSDDEGSMDLISSMADSVNINVQSEIHTQISPSKVDVLKAMYFGYLVSSGKGIFNENAISPVDDLAQFISTNIAEALLENDLETYEKLSGAWKHLRLIQSFDAAKIKIPNCSSGYDDVQYGNYSIDVKLYGAQNPFLDDEVLPPGNADVIFQLNTSERSLESAAINCGVKVKSFPEDNEVVKFSCKLNGGNLKPDQIIAGLESSEMGAELIPCLSITSEGDSIRISVTVPIEENEDFIDDLSADQILLLLSSGLDVEVGTIASCDKIFESLQALMDGFFIKSSSDFGTMSKKQLLSCIFDDMNPMEWESSLSWADSADKQIIQLILKAFTLDFSGSLKISCPPVEIPEEQNPREFITDAMRETVQEILDDNPTVSFRDAMCEILRALEIAEIRLEVPKVKSLPGFTTVISFQGVRNPLTQEVVTNIINGAQ